MFEYLILNTIFIYYEFQRTKLKSERIKIKFSTLRSKIKLTISKNPRKFLENLLL